MAILGNETVAFIDAKPIWIKGKQTEMNLNAGFTSAFNCSSKTKTILKVTGSSVYRIFVNGHFAGYGPARASHGYFRVDEWDISRFIKNKQQNILCIEVVGYNINSFYLLDQPAFIQAEIISGKNILAATGLQDCENSKHFDAIFLTDRIQKVPKYSFQRTFVECYDLNKDYNSWLHGRANLYQKAEIEITESKTLLPRNVSYPDFKIINPNRIIADGKVKSGIKPDNYWKDRSLVNISSKLKGFRENELEYNPSTTIQELKNLYINPLNRTYKNKKTIFLDSEQFKIFGFKINSTGFIGAEIDVLRKGKVIFIFDEKLTNEDLSFNRTSTINSVTYELEEGKYLLESFEPYTLKYLKIIMLDGACKIKNITLREFANSDTKQISFVCSNDKINMIFQAAIDTYRQNSVDLFTDCPSRERAGWLCDSYFMGRAAHYISGNSRVERNFIENYMLPDSFAYIPKGMIPMCYPADHYNGQFIPNWSMWFILQLHEYLERSNDKEMIYKLKPRVLEIISYFKRYKNTDGLLERLPGWIFVEWSDANKFVQDVNYPTNMLYAAMLDKCAELYQIDSLKTEAYNIREVIRNQSFNGSFFIDNSNRDKNGVLSISNNISEVCQYYAFYFDVASPQTHPELWKKMFLDLSPLKSRSEMFKNLVPANILKGIPLRLLLLTKYNLSSQFVDECASYLYYMAENTGTFWEHTSTRASLNHGFMSFVAVDIIQNVLGVTKIDHVNKLIYVTIPTVNLTFCSAKIPIGNDSFTYKWKKNGKKINRNYILPEGYKIIADNRNYKLPDFY
jgi:alpha-L-rhamnosidase